MKKFLQLTLIAALVPAAYSQSVLYTFDGDSVEDSCGARVSGAWDVNMDGYDDLIVGISSDDNNGQQAGVGVDVIPPESVDRHRFGRRACPVVLAC